MKYLIFLMSLSAIAAFGGNALEPVLTRYADLQNALANDHFDHARMSAGKLNTVIEKTDVNTLNKETREVWKNQLAKLKASTLAASKSSDIASLRAQFNSISEAMIALNETADASLNRFHCPMANHGKGADWLQTGNTTMNPYYGSAMLRCGSMTKKAEN